MSDDEEHNHMDEVVPGLWVGDLYSAKDYETLKANNIHSVLTAMRGRVAIHETFMRHQIMLDDTEDADILQHLIPSITFIQAEIEKGRGVLVHCQAGMSRSATIVAAYLMYSRNLDASGALELVSKARPSIQPNDGFLMQLEIFHEASYKVSRKDKATRMFYLERAVEEILNGDGTLPETAMFAKFPRTPSDSTPGTPGPQPRRRIRCKMCRTELAAREHMLDHGQLGPPTPAFSPPTSRRPSMANDRPLAPLNPLSPASRRGSAAASRRPSAGALGMAPMTSITESSGGGANAGPGGQPRKRVGSESSTKPRRGSNLAFEGTGLLSGLAASMAMSALETDDTDGSAGKSKEGSGAQVQRRKSSGAGGEGRPRFGGGFFGSALSMSAVESDDDDDESVVAPPVRCKSAGSGSAAANGTALPTLSRPSTIENGNSNAREASKSPPPTSSAPPKPNSPTPQGFQSPVDLAAQLYNNPKLAALRSPPLMGMTPIQTNGPASPSGSAGMVAATVKASMSPPILANPKCSGYFVEPMNWMEFFLEDGNLAGKIICPNAKCGVKLGNYDWAGVCCSCKEWVTPGFCIHRSKVDEIV